MSPREVAALLALLALAGSVPPVAAGVAAQQPPAQQADDPTGLGPPVETVMDVKLRPDGDARWTVTARFPNLTAEQTEAFGELREAFENNETSDLGLAGFRRASRAASEATGRSMQITNVTYDSGLENGTGRLVLQFTWENFGRKAGTKLYVDDAFDTTTGTWLSSLGENQTLIVRPPQEYAVTSASTGPVDGVLRWQGPRTFAAGDLAAVYQRVQDTPPATTSPGSTPADLAQVALLAGGGLLIAVVGYFFASRRDRFPGEPTDGDGVPPSAPAEATEQDGGAGPAETPEATAADEEGAGSPPIDEELLSDEERVERLLERNGGRMKQAAIVEATGWSNAKVSQLLSSMAEEGRIDKLRIGRENLISFPDEDLGEFE